MIRLPTLALLATLFVPSAVFIMFASSSGTLGLAISACIWIIGSLSGGGNAYKVSREDGACLISGIGVMVLLAIHLAVASLVAVNLEVGRFLSSATVFILIWIGAYYASKLLLRTPV